MDDSNPAVVLEFNGQLMFDTISTLLIQLKDRTGAMGEKINTYKRLLTITIEVLENCYRYLENKKELKKYQEKYPSFIRIEKHPENFKIQAGNVITGDDTRIISEKLETVNALDEDGLRELYKKTISDGKFSEVGGAGLGFVEIAKACGKKIVYSFDQIDQDIYYYTIKLDVKS
jgi:hypothetical protein